MNEAPVTAQAAPEAAPAPEAAQTQTPEKTEELSPRFAALAKKERALAEMQKQLKAEREGLAKEREEYKTKFIDRDSVLKNPVRFALENGFTYDKLAELVMTGAQDPDPMVERLEQKLNKFEETLAEKEKRERESEQKRYEQAKEEIRRQAKLLVDGNDSYETIRETGNTEAIVSLIEATYQEEGRVMPVEEAAKLIEEQLLEEALTYAKVKKFRERLTAQEQKTEATQPTAQKTQAQDQKPKLETLTNAATASPAKPLSRRERRERAMLAGMGQLQR